MSSPSLNTLGKPVTDDLACAWDSARAMTRCASKYRRLRSLECPRQAEGFGVGLETLVHRVDLRDRYRVLGRHQFSEWSVVGELAWGSSSKAR